ncbi:MAG: hypothetical protein ABTS22_21675 [Accumulibacter sp.]
MLGLEDDVGNLDHPNLVCQSLRQRNGQQSDAKESRNKPTVASKSYGSMG